MQGITLDLPLEGRQGLANGLDGEVRQGQRQVAQAHPGFIGWLDAADGGAGLAGDEVAHQLRRGLVVAAAEDEGVGLQAFLELDARQRASRVIHFRGDTHDDAGVGVALVTRVLAHAVGDDPVRLAGGRYHCAAGAHAEAVYRAAVLGVVHQLVVGGAELRVAGILAQACLVDQRLRVFDAEPHREGLGLHEHALGVEHAEGVAGAVAQGQDHMARFQLLAAFQDYAGQLLALGEQVGDLLLEAHLAAQVDDLLAHLLDHAGQAEGADVRLVDVEDFFRRTGLDELFQDLAAMVLRVLDLAVQLAVGEGPGAAFAELHVGFGVEHALAPQAPGVLGALAHFLAAFEHDRLEAHLCQQQAGEDAARAEAHHDRSFLLTGRGLADELVADVRRRVDVAVVGELLQQGRLVAHVEVDGVDEQQFRGLLARVVAALEQGEVEQVVAGDPQALHDGGAQVFIGMVERQLEFGDS